MSKQIALIKVKFGTIKRCLKMLQGFRIEEGKRFSNCKDHKKQIVINVTERSKKIS